MARVLICPWCDKQCEMFREEAMKNVVVYKCNKCGSVIGAYLRDLEDYLLNFFQRYKMDTFMPEPTIRKGSV